MKHRKAKRPWQYKSNEKWKRGTPDLFGPEEPKSDAEQYANNLYLANGRELDAIPQP
jgi:hypothetical protein